MSVFYADDAVTLQTGDCIEVMRQMPDSSVDAIVTDPPYELTAGKKGGTGAASINLNSPAGRARITVGGGGFMGKSWDATGVAFDPATWRECLRVLKPGGHMLAFGGTRTYHRMACAIDDAGFEIRDCLMWLYGSGFPKSLDVSKAIDKAAGAQREVVGTINRAPFGYEDRPWKHAEDASSSKVTAPATGDAKKWLGFGTALKPAYEPIILARKPLRGTVAANVLEHGTGALNIDGTRTQLSDADREKYQRGIKAWREHGERYGDGHKAAEIYGKYGIDSAGPHAKGRFPANVILDEDAAAQLDKQSRQTASGSGSGSGSGGIWGPSTGKPAGPQYGDSGGASRFFYTAKADAAERPKVNGVSHPTVKPLDLMRWLVRLITPPGGTVLDPFAGSGTTGEAAVIEGFKAILIEREQSYLPLIVARLSKPIEPTLFGGM